MPTALINASRHPLDCSHWLSDHVRHVPADEISLRRNPHDEIVHAKKRLKPEALPTSSPSFPMSPGGTVLTVGSCLARHMERDLAKLGYIVPTLRMHFPPGESGVWDNQVLNKFTPPSIYQEIAWAHAIYSRDDLPTEADSVSFGYTCADGRMIDLHLSKYASVSPARFYERRSEVYRIFREAFRADLVTLTFGTTECWFDQKHNLFILSAPSVKRLEADRSRFSFTALSFKTCLTYATATVDLIRSVNPNCAFIVTTSAEVSEQTFTRQDILTANLESKSILRAVCGELSRRYGRLDYFPSFENALLTRSWSVYGEDMRQLSSAFAARSVQHLVDRYFIDNSPINHAYHLARKKNAQQIEEAIELLAPLAQAPSTHLEASIYLSDLLLRDKQFEKAAVLLKLLCDQLPENGTLWFHLANAYGELGQLEKAVHPAQKAIEFQPANSSYHRYLANIQESLGRSDEAIETLGANLMLNARCFGTHVQLGKLFIKLGRNVDAAASLRWAIESKETHALPYILLADLLIVSGQLDEAETVLYEGLKLVSNQSSIHHGIARLKSARARLSIPPTP